jgi:AAA+ ATPase superfamily predicted ATPase
MKNLAVGLKKNFVGRTVELEKLKEIGRSNKEACIIVMYGRRRVGKTELLEQSFRDRNLLKFEGIEGLNEKDQLANVMSQLALYTQDPSMPQRVNTWREFFQLLASYTGQGVWTIYLEELQWLARYESSIISELKYVWDNYFRRNNQLILILCGSAPSFMIDHVVHSKALYNRSEHIFHLKEFNLVETKEFLKKRSDREVMDAYLTIGGVPEYLKWVGTQSSVLLSLCQNSFTPNGFFTHEYERIFTSSLSTNKYYKQIIDLLSQRRFATRKEIAQALKIESGGSLSSVLLDLEKSGFINNYHPFNLEESTILTRYSIDDNYLQYYFKFIQPLQKNVDAGAYISNPKGALKMDSYIKWLGFSFERFCRKFHYILAKILHFSGVHYRSGAFFSRSTDKENPGCQIDLIFDRDDNVYTLCEIKYLRGKVGTGVIEEFERKLALFPNKTQKTIHKVLICNEGMDEALEKEGYFDDVITGTQLFDPRNW